MGANGFHCCFVHFTQETSTWIFHDVSCLQMAFITVFSIKKQQSSRSLPTPWAQPGTTLYLQIHHAIGPVPEIKPWGLWLPSMKLTARTWKLMIPTLEHFFGGKTTSNIRVWAVSFRDCVVVEHSHESWDIESVQMICIYVYVNIYGYMGKSRPFQRVIYIYIWCITSLVSQIWIIKDWDYCILVETHNGWTKWKLYPSP